jgi:2-dehydro-3-deoxyphosphogluconate aldolase/(4S)-4-hydroxy-2-oxoglutarate aldolase
MDEVVSELRRLKLVPVIVIDNADNAAPLARALIAGGLPCAEVTFRTPGAAESLRRITAEFPGMLVGAGTVLTPEQAHAAMDAGAKFIVAPGFSPAVVDYCVEREIPVFPGVCTPTEIEAALTKGLRILKFFPAEPMGGVSFIRAVATAYPEVEFMPTGGINAANVAAYFEFDRILACGGSWMATREWIAARAFDRIREATAQAVGLLSASAGAR